MNDHRSIRLLLVVGSELIHTRTRTPVDNEDHGMAESVFFAIDVPNVE